MAIIFLFNLYPSAPSPSWECILVRFFGGSINSSWSLGHRVHGIGLGAPSRRAGSSLSSESQPVGWGCNQPGWQFQVFFLAQIPRFLFWHKFQKSNLEVEVERAALMKRSWSDTAFEEGEARDWFCDAGCVWRSKVPFSLLAGRQWPHSGTAWCYRKWAILIVISLVQVELCLAVCVQLIFNLHIAVDLLCFGTGFGIFGTWLLFSVLAATATVQSSTDQDVMVSGVVSTLRFERELVSILQRSRGGLADAEVLGSAIDLAGACPLRWFFVGILVETFFVWHGDVLNKTCNRYVMTPASWSDRDRHRTWIDGPAVLVLHTSIRWWTSLGFLETAGVKVGWFLEWQYM